MDLLTQLVWLFVLAIPIACISWTITHEEIFKDFNEYCTRKHEEATNFWKKKFFYALTCEYCISHYITILVLLFTGYWLLIDDWRGYIIAGFALVWVANVYMSLFSFIRVGIKSEKKEIDLKEQELENTKSQK